MAEFLDIYKFWWNCPFINVSRIERKLLRGQNIVDFIKKMIDCGAYVMVVIDTFYIPSYVSFSKHHHPHEIFIYGYDENDFYTADYFDFTNCTSHKVKFAEFYDSYTKFGEEEKDYLGGVVMFNPNRDVLGNGKEDLQYDENHTYIPDKVIIREKLLGFFNSSPLVLASYPNEFDPCFGFKTGYQAFETMLNEFIPENFKRYSKPLCLLHAHIKLMTLRIHYFEEYFKLPLNTLYVQCSELEQRAKILVGIYLKAAILNRSSDHKIQNSLRDIILEYKKLIQELVGLL